MKYKNLNIIVYAILCIIVFIVVFVAGIKSNPQVNMKSKDEYSQGKGKETSVDNRVNIENTVSSTGNISNLGERGKR